MSNIYIFFCICQIQTKTAPDLNENSIEISIQFHFFEINYLFMLRLKPVHENDFINFKLIFTEKSSFLFYFFISIGFSPILIWILLQLSN